jgi:pimeloyl-ACP methyl ester carboxylesterase
MKITRTIFRLSFLIVLSLLLVTSCKKDEQGKTYSYFVSKQFVTVYQQSLINGLLDVASASVPGISNIKPLVTTDVNVYKIVYKTTVNGNQINASGLICVPVTPGEYPVLSFQNGTNTVNADAPSNNPADFTYKLVEFIASMGYVVVIPDYPGFGESSQIPHPYLIKEPTVRSLVDMLYTTKEIGGKEFPGITFKNEYYLLGYSQGGWATLALDKAIEQDYSSDFNLKGSSCGAGPYNILQLLEGIINQPDYPEPVYFAYIVNAYIAYNQFTNPAGDILNEPYASRLSSLFTGLLTLAQINNELTTSITGLLTADFISGFSSSSKYSSVRDALNNNSVTEWHSYKPLLLTHGGNDTQVNPVSTENMYNAMIQAGTSQDLCKMVIVPNVDHGDGVVPCMIEGILFLDNLKNSR